MYNACHRQQPLRPTALYGQNAFSLGLLCRGMHAAIQVSEGPDAQM